MMSGHRSRALPPEVGTRLEVLVLAVHGRHAVTCLPGQGRHRRLVLRPGPDLWELSEGWLATIDVSKTWVFGGSTYVSCTVAGLRLDIGAWGLPALEIFRRGEWTPDEMELDWPDWVPDPPPPWKDPNRAPGVRACFEEIMQAGCRRIWEMEQVIPGFDEETWDGDPIVEAAEAGNAGDWDRAHRLLQECLLEDLRCIDAHAHLGLLAYRGSSAGARKALRHYQAGVAAGDHTLGPEFNGLLPWDCIDNRPYLRAAHGLGLCLWMLADFGAASRVFRRLLWLDPRDRLGVAWLLDEVERGQPCQPEL